MFDLAEGQLVLWGSAEGTAADTEGELWQDLAGFHPAVRAWFRRRFPDGPTDPQRLAWPEIASGQNTLVAAPTGSGKTLAALLVPVDQILRSGQDRPATQVLYVSPLRALAADVASNLSTPLAQIAQVAKDLGQGRVDLRVAVRTGDSTPKDRSGVLRRPPQVLATTPESLYLMLTSPGGRKMLAGVRYVVVDEIHSLATDKRGAHLALSLERLEGLCDCPPVRIGLSATQKPIETLGRLLVGNRPLPAVVDLGHRRQMDLSIWLAEAPLEAVPAAAVVEEALDWVAAEVARHRSTLVFVNTRHLAERFAHQLAERLGDGAVGTHHGSLSASRRQEVEERLRAGELKALVATASLELGIDVGPVELVCQISSPRSISTFLQRVGRSNHSRFGRPKGVLMPLTRDQLVECAALMLAVRKGRLDTLGEPAVAIDVLAQQLVAEVSATERSLGELEAMVRMAAHYRDISREQFEAVIELVSEGVTTGRGTRGAYLHVDCESGQVRARKNARLAAVTSGGAIPETAEFKVVLEPEGTVVGTVDEDWALDSAPGDVFLLGSRTWRLQKVRGDVVSVTDAGDLPPSVPFWLGEAPGRTRELSESLSELRARVAQLVRSGDSAQARSWLCRSCGVGARAAEAIVGYLEAGLEALGEMPTLEVLVLERFFDQSGGMQLVLHSPCGIRTNRALGLALRKKFCRKFDFELQAAATDDAVVLSLGLTHSFELSEVPRYLRSSSLRSTLEQAVLDFPMFATRWRWNLNRSLLVLRFIGGRRNPPHIQRIQAEDLLAAVFPQAAACQDNLVGPRQIPDHILVRQTLDDTFREALDLEGATRLWEDVEAGRVRVHCVDTVCPSVLAHEVITAAPYAFLDDEEAQNRRVRAVEMPRRFEAHPFGRELDPQVLEETAKKLAPRPQQPDQLHDLLRACLCLRPLGEASGLMAILEARGRALNYEGMWVARDSLQSALAAMAGSQAEVEKAVRGHLELLGLTTASALAYSSGLDEQGVHHALQSLRQKGFAFCGRWLAGEDEQQWTTRRVLAVAASRSSKRTRQDREPADPGTFVSFGRQGDRTSRGYRGPLGGAAPGPGPPW